METSEEVTNQFIVFRIAEHIKSAQDQVDQKEMELEQLRTEYQKFFNSMLKALAKYGVSETQVNDIIKKL